MKSMEEICDALCTISDRVSFDRKNNSIQLYDYCITAYVYDNKLYTDIEYNGRKYREVFWDYDRLYSFISGVLTGKVTFRPLGERTIIADGYNTEIPKNTNGKRIFRVVLNTLAGLLFTIFGAMLAVNWIMHNIDFSSPDWLFDMCPLPVAVGITIIGVSMIHHGFARKPISIDGSVLYGIGVLLICFATSLLMATYGDKSQDIAKADLIGVSFVFILVIAVGIFMLISGLHLKAEKADGNNILFIHRVPQHLTLKELERLTNAVKERSLTETIELTTYPFGNHSITDSKLGGLPYWDETMPYPVDSQGKNMFFLAQFNLSQLPETQKLPHEGMLQFFIDDADNCRVIYHKTIDTCFTADDALKLGIIMDDDNDILPFSEECGLNFKLADMMIGSEDIFGMKLIQNTAKELGLEIEEDVTLDEILTDQESPDTEGHHLLGYPSFVQGDPRTSDSRYNTLLFQLDSEMSERFSIMWGDCGVADFFINDNDLKNHNFDDVFFTWNCY